MGSSLRLSNLCPAVHLHRPVRPELVSHSSTPMFVLTVSAIKALPDLTCTWCNITFKTPQAKVQHRLCPVRLVFIVHLFFVNSMIYLQDEGCKVSLSHVRFQVLLIAYLGVGTKEVLTSTRMLAGRSTCRSRIVMVRARGKTNTGQAFCLLIYIMSLQDWILSSDDWEDVNVLVFP
jgi:hypothetical protein